MISFKTYEGTKKQLQKHQTKHETTVEIEKKTIEHDMSFQSQTDGSNPQNRWTIAAFGHLWVPQSISMSTAANEKT